MANPVTISEDTASPNFNAGAAESVLVLIGCAAGGVAANTPKIARNDKQPAEYFTAGPLVEVGAIVVGEGRQPAVLIRAATTTPAAYGAVDDSDFTGTVEVDVDAAVVPYNAYDAYIIFDNPDDVDLGTSGISYQTSLDDGTRVLDALPLGTATSITIADGNVKFTLSPPLAAVLTLVNELRDDAIAHYALVGSVHLAADTTSDDGIGVAATTLATAIALGNQIRAAEILHATNNTAHTGDDTTSFASLPAAATDGPSLVTLLNALKAAHNTHLATEGSVHGAADATNTTSAADATSGTINTGDVIRVTTTAPVANAASIEAALDLLPTYNGSVFGGFCILGPIADSGTWDAVIAALDALEERQRPCDALVETRLPNDGESESDYRAAVETIWSGRADNRVGIFAGYGEYDPSVVRQAKYYHRRTALAPGAARHVSIRYEQSPAFVKPLARPAGATPSTYGGKLRGYRIYNSSGEAVGHDESVNPGIKQLRLITTTSYPQEGLDAFLDEPLTLRPPDDTVYLIPIRRIANVMKRIIYKTLTREIQGYNLLKVGQTTISEAAANDLDKLVQADLRNEVGDRVTSFTFELDRTANITGVSPRIPWSASVRTGIYAAGFDGVFAINK